MKMVATRAGDVIMGMAGGDGDGDDGVGAAAADGMMVVMDVIDVVMAEVLTVNGHGVVVVKLAW
jgi:hypothetical protein